jgi:hypothetical protein
MAVFSLDFGVVTGIFCFFSMDFVTDLVCSTFLAALAIPILVVGLCSPQGSPRRRSAVLVGVYLLIFIYPVVAVKVVMAFGCEEVVGVFYLKADYSIECSSSTWYALATYASLWVGCFVVALPAFLFRKLWTYRFKLKRGHKQVGDLRYGFLLDDYKLNLPCMLWESAEMVRKLLLSVVGAFFSSKSVLCVTCGMLISLCGLLAHVHYYPFKSLSCNRLQSLSLSVLTFIYLVGTHHAYTILTTHTHDTHHAYTLLTMPTHDNHHASRSAFY